MDINTLLPRYLYTTKPDRYNNPIIQFIGNDIIHTAQNENHITITPMREQHPITSQRLELNIADPDLLNRLNTLLTLQTLNIINPILLIAFIITTVTAAIAPWNTLNIANLIALPLVLTITAMRTRAATKWARLAKHK